MSTLAFVPKRAGHVVSSDQSSIYKLHRFFWYPSHSNRNIPIKYIIFFGTLNNLLHGMERQYTPHSG